MSRTPREAATAAEGAATKAIEQLEDVLAGLVADRLAERLLNAFADATSASPWLSTAQAIAYSALPEGTFRKLAACGKIPSHGGRTKLFYRPELDESLLRFAGLGEERRELRRVQ